MSNLITEIFEAFRESFEYIASLITGLIDSIESVIEQPALLPDLWDCFPEAIQEFFLGIVIINAFIIVFFALIRKQ